MIVELRGNGRTIVPRRIAADLGLEEGMWFAAFPDEGVVKLVPAEDATGREWPGFSAKANVVERQGKVMYVELRRNLQVIIPKKIAGDLDLKEGDMFDVVEEDGVIKLIPVVVLSRAEHKRLLDLERKSKTPGHASGASLATAPAAAEAPEHPVVEMQPEPPAPVVAEDAAGTE